jgi:hypothetical protein
VPARSRAAAEILKEVRRRALEAPCGTRVEEIGAPCGGRPNFERPNENPRTVSRAQGLNCCDDETMPVILPDGTNKKDVSPDRSIYSRLWTGGILLLARGAMLACGWPGGLVGGGLTDG